MEKVIEIGDKRIKLNNNAAWCLEYRDQFGGDPLREHVPLIAGIAEGLATIAGNMEGETLTLETVLSALEGNTLDIMLPLMQTDLMTTVINITWAMAKAADESIDPPKQWLRQFEVFPLDEIVPAIYELAFKGFVSSKNLKRLRNLLGNVKDVVQNLKETQPSLSTTSSSQEQNED